MDTLVHEGDLRVRIEPDQNFGDIRDYDEGLPHELRPYDPYNFGREREAVMEHGGPLFYEFATFMRNNWWREDSDDYATKVFCRYVELVHGGVTEMDGTRIFYLLPKDAGGCTDRELLRNQLEGGIAEIRAWEAGEVYGYVIERETKWSRVTDDDRIDERRTTWEVIDSCWGFIGWDHVAETATDAFMYAKI